MGVRTFDKAKPVPENHWLQKEDHLEDLGELTEEKLTEKIESKNLFVIL